MEEHPTVKLLEQSILHAIFKAVGTDVRLSQPLANNLCQILETYEQRNSCRSMNHIPDKHIFPIIKHSKRLPKTKFSHDIECQKAVLVYHIQRLSRISKLRAKRSDMHEEVLFHVL